MKILENGDLVSVYDDGTVKVWDVENGTIKKDIAVDSAVYSLEVLHNGNLATGCKGGTVKIWQ